MSTLRARMPVLVALSIGGGMLLMYAVVAAAHRMWFDLVVTAVTGAAQLGTAAWVALSLDRPPSWSTRFELVALPIERPGAVSRWTVRCNRCDSTVFPSAQQMALPRLLRYTLLHTYLACEPRRATDPDNTQRLRRPARSPHKGP